MKQRMVSALALDVRKPMSFVPSYQPWYKQRSSLCYLSGLISYFILHRDHELLLRSMWNSEVAIQYKEGLLLSFALASIVNIEVAILMLYRSLSVEVQNFMFFF
jgi:hypothetical protein